MIDFDPEDEGPTYILCNLDGTIATAGKCKAGDIVYAPVMMHPDLADQENRDFHTQGLPFVYIEKSRIEGGRVVRDPHGRKSCDICSRPSNSKTCSECSKVLIIQSVPDEGDEE